VEGIVYLQGFPWDRQAPHERRSCEARNGKGVILPRGIPAKLGRVVFISMRSLFRLKIGRNATYERRDRVMAAYAPTSLLMLLVVWISLVLGGYSAMFWGLGGRSLRRAFTLSVRHPDPPALLILLQRQIAIVR